MSKISIVFLLILIVYILAVIIVIGYYKRKSKGVKPKLKTNLFKHFKNYLNK